MNNFKSLRPLSGLNRRQFFSATACSGFALAALPISASTIRTDNLGLTAHNIKIPVGGEEIAAYAAWPKIGKSFPVILVIQEIFGVHEHIKDVCRRFAKLGYLAIAPDLYQRQGNPAAVPDITTLQREIVSRVHDAQVMTDLDATIAWAIQNKGRTNQVGITGFCWGGRITWLYAAHNPNIKAGVAWYGRLLGQISPITPHNPIDIAGKLQAPVLGLYGGRDSGITQDAVTAMRYALQAGASSNASRASQIIVYSNAEHGFNADYRASYRAEDAQAGFALSLAWFKDHGVGG